MNIKNNRRNQETSEAIIRTVYQILIEEKKPIEKITVREICESARIHRSTFYAHFQDIYDVVEVTEKHMSEELGIAFMNKLNQGASSDECFESLFTFIQSHQKFYRLYLNGTEHSGVIGVSWELFKDRIEQLDYRKFGMNSKEELEYISTFFHSGMTAMIRRWINRGCPETPAEMVRILKKQSTPFTMNW